MSVPCIRRDCKGRGLRKNSGYCEACYFEVTYGLERSREDAKRVAALSGRAFAVVVLHPDCEASKRAAKIGVKAYSVLAADNTDGHEVVEIHDGKAK